MKTNSILKEIRSTRDQLAEEAGGDMRRQREEWLRTGLDELNRLWRKLVGCRNEKSTDAVVRVNAASQQAWQSENARTVLVGAVNAAPKAPGGAALCKRQASTCSSLADAIRRHGRSFAMNSSTATSRKECPP